MHNLKVPHFCKSMIISFCRHVADLYGKFATNGATGRTSASPGEELFARFREAFADIRDTIDWTQLDGIITKFEWEYYAGTELAAAAIEMFEKP